ncbi:hypothetical protein KP509_03G034200 [Ceratopteris richardii]|uniref:Fungal lipase-like domain-containing protein n=1 Tax=Ceratopteris richardii TaxID=49495 RepID=A0A8T2UYL3_CERRI|nr:hypothetical protein KP509_03G034200 [Ceratopteris richardii]
MSKMTLMLSGFPRFSKVRLLHRLFAVAHLLLAGMAAWGASMATNRRPRDLIASCASTSTASVIRLLWMIGSAVCQAAVASTMLTDGVEPALVSSSNTGEAGNKIAPTIRRKRKMWYAYWLWWGRFGAFVTLLQILGATYLTYSFLKLDSVGINPWYSADGSTGWHRSFFLALSLAAWLLTITQCCVGSEIFAWSSLYARQNNAWRAYYHEMFDYGIREALCCLGRAHYINSKEDEVDSIAAVLGELVSYRAAGAGHLEFLAGLALLQIQGSSVPSLSDSLAPTHLIREASILHTFAVAAYTGPLLDIGRSHLMFPCVWLYRQGVFTPWCRNRLPKLEGDNWWRGHAAAFLRYSKLPPEAIRQGRVHQAKLECAYFVIVIKELQSVVVAVRGTETPEDLLTDGLGRECVLSDSDLCGLFQSDRISQEMKQKLSLNSPHFAHEGIIMAARELAQQLDDFSDSGRVCFSSNSQDLYSLAEDTPASRKPGILSKLLGPGRECEGFKLYLVGHSLGGSIAALTAMRLCGRYPQVHVYGYGVLPCVDASLADACSDFVTSIVYNDEFSSRLSIASIKRLRVAAIKALALESGSDFGAIKRLTQQLLGAPSAARLFDRNNGFSKEITVAKPLIRHKWKRFRFQLKGRDNDDCNEESEVLVVNDDLDECRHPSSTHNIIEENSDFSSEEISANAEIKTKGKAPLPSDIFVDSQTLHASQSGEQDNHYEMFMPGTIVHLVPVECSKSGQSSHSPGKKAPQGYQYRAFIKDRRSFQDLVISTSMFLDHMPWRCQHAMDKVLEHEKEYLKDTYGSRESFV